MDFFGDVGELGLGSRLKRLSDRMMQDGAGIYQDVGFDFKPAWFPTFGLLHRRGATAVGQIAAQLGVTHVAINQVLDELQSAGLVRSNPGPSDKRIRLAELTPEGEQLADRLTEVWDTIRAAIGEAIEESGHDLMDAIARMETCLDRRSFRTRFGDLWANTVDIVPFESALRTSFWEVNSAWINEHFVMEEIDERVLKNPETEILEPGGAIYFARDRRTGEIVGTCALMPHGGHWELAKMGVKPTAQGKGIGQKLGQAVIDHARARGIEKLVLETNSGLKPAINLYRKLGFVHVPQMEKSDYIRSDVTMELNLAR